MTTIKVRWQKEGWHSWPQALGARSYLKHNHRHLFHWEVEMEVRHIDREIEFHDLLEICREAQANLKAGSCEQMAGSLLQFLQKAWPQRFIAVECWEDGECGARVTT